MGDNETKQGFIISTLIGTAGLLVGGAIGYGLFLQDVISSVQMKADPVWWALPAGLLFGGAAIASVLCWAGANTFVAGAKAAGWIGLLISICLALTNYAMVDAGHTITNMIVDPLSTAVIWGFAGGFVGMMRGRRG